VVLVEPCDNALIQPDAPPASTRPGRGRNAIRRRGVRNPHQLTPIPPRPVQQYGLNLLPLQSIAPLPSSEVLTASDLEDLDNGASAVALREVYLTPSCSR
jgi:hypothetical protein